MFTAQGRTNSSQRVASWRKLWWVAFVAAATAFVSALIVFGLAQLLNMPLEILTPPAYEVLAPLQMSVIAWATIPPAIGATVLLALLGRFTRRPFLIFQIIALVFLLLSFGGPLSLPVSGTVKVVLGIMHTVAASAIVGVLSTLGREK